ELVEFKPMVAPPFLPFMLAPPVDHHYPVKSQSTDKGLRLPRANTDGLDTGKLFERFHEAPAKITVNEILTYDFEVQRFLLLTALHMVVDHKHFVEQTYFRFEHDSKVHRLRAHGNGCLPILISMTIHGHTVGPNG